MAVPCCPMKRCPVIVPFRVHIRPLQQQNLHRLSRFRTGQNQFDTIAVCSWQFVHCHGRTCISPVLAAVRRSWAVVVLPARMDMFTTKKMSQRVASALPLELFRRCPFGSAMFACIPRQSECSRLRPTAARVDPTPKFTTSAEVDWTESRGRLSCPVLSGAAGRKNHAFCRRVKKCEGPNAARSSSVHVHPEICCT